MAHTQEDEEALRPAVLAPAPGRRRPRALAPTRQAASAGAFCARPWLAGGGLTVSACPWPAGGATALGRARHHRSAAPPPRGGARR